MQDGPINPAEICPLIPPQSGERWKSPETDLTRIFLDVLLGKFTIWQHFFFIMYNCRFLRASWASLAVVGIIVLKHFSNFVPIFNYSITVLFLCHFKSICISYHHLIINNIFESFCIESFFLIHHFLFIIFRRICSRSANFNNFIDAFRLKSL